MAFAWTMLCRRGYDMMRLHNANVRLGRDFNRLKTLRKKFKMLDSETTAAVARSMKTPRQESSAAVCQRWARIRVGGLVLCRPCAKAAR